MSTAKLLLMAKTSRRLRLREELLKDSMRFRAGFALIQEPYLFLIETKIQTSMVAA